MPCEDTRAFDDLSQFCPGVSVPPVQTHLIRSIKATKNSALQRSSASTSLINGRRSDFANSKSTE